MDHARIAGSVRLLLEARRNGRKLTGLPPSVGPTSAAEGYAIQRAIAHAAGVPIGGWKAGLVPGVRFTYASVPRHAVLDSPARFTVPCRAVSAGTDFAFIEGEIGFRLRHDLPPRSRPYGRDEVADAIDCAAAAIEIGNPRTLDFLAAPLEYKIADSMGNGAIVWGSGDAAWRQIDLARLTVTMQADGVTVLQIVGGNRAGDPLDALVALANEPSKSDPLLAGQTIITGNCTGSYEASPGTRIDVVFDGFGQVQVELN